MKYINFFETNNLIESANLEREITEFELTNEFLLPIEFKEMMLETNGGTLKFQNSAFVIENIENEKLIVFDLYFLNFYFVKHYFNENRLNNEPHVFENIKSILLIGRTAMREYIFIGLEKDNFGRIFYAPDDNIFDFILETDDSYIYPTIEIASNINSFLLSLKSSEELEKNL